ncbi:MAG: secondary thiamine-phosphate synthase enzyme YjbQ [Gammaproteobacteria bacterium]
MKIHHETLNVSTLPGVDIRCLDKDVEAVIGRSGLNQGLVTITPQHTTCAITVNEYESRLVDDIRLYLRRLVPETGPWLHNDIHLRDCPRDEPENAHAHIMAMLMGAAQTLPLRDGALTLGRWQSLLFLELDGPRERTIDIQITGAP